MHLNFTNTVTWGTMSFTLYRKQFLGFSTSYGSHTFNVSDGMFTARWKVNTDSTKYYLFIMDEGSYAHYTGYGTMYDHSLK